MNCQSCNFAKKYHKDMTLIADSGSTKTAWCLIGDGHHTFHTQGINPFQQTEEEICNILKKELLPQLSIVNPQSSIINCPSSVVRRPLSVVHFYGAGCTKEKAPIVFQALSQAFPSATQISVESDMLGAARGLCQHQPGIVCILGTGSNSCYYDGTTLHAGNPALGYILGDEGSGAYIGKRLAGDILKKQLPKHVIQQFFDETGESQESIIQKVYREPLPNRFLASLSPFCARHREEAAIHHLLIDCFRQFFQRNIACVNWPTEENTVHFVGSIAHHYQEELHEAARQYGYKVGNILQAPLEGLITFHQT